MTVMHSLNAARYLTIAHLLEPPCWPFDTTLLADDVVFHDSSLAELGKTATPAVRVGEALPDRSGTASPRQRFVSIVVCSVVAVAAAPRGRMLITIDADVRGCEPYYAHLRVLGRPPARRLKGARVQSADATPGARVRVPRDIRVGDVLALPCEGLVTLAALRHGQRTAVEVAHSVAADSSADAAAEDGDDDTPPCGRHVRRA